MVEDESTSYMTGGIYRELVPPERLVFSWGAVDGWPTIDPERLDDVPVVTITLNDMDSTTQMFVHVGLADHLTEDQVRDWFSTGMAQGWSDTLDRLSGLLSPRSAPAATDASA